APHGGTTKRWKAAFVNAKAWQCKASAFWRRPDALALRPLPVCLHGAHAATSEAHGRETGRCMWLATSRTTGNTTHTTRNSHSAGASESESPGAGACSSTKSASRSSSNLVRNEKLTVYTEGSGEFGKAVKAISGTYVENGTACGRKTYEKEGNEDSKVIIYYWDDRDGPDFQGWWFGNTLAGPQVWARCLEDSTRPPMRGWRIPWNGEEEEALRVELEADRQERLARPQLDDLKQQAQKLMLAAKKVQEKARVVWNKKQIEEVNNLLAELSQIGEALREISSKAAAIPKPNRSMSGNGLLEDFQEFSNRVSDAFTALQKEDANLRRVSKEVEDARKREEQEKLDSLAMQHFLPDIKSIVNEAEDEVEKALITHEMIANAEEDSKLHAVEMTEAACARAQQALDGVRASLKAKRSELPQLDSSAPRGELELQRLEKHLQAAQLKLKPLKAARNEWNMQRRSKKMIEEVEEKIILAEVELDRLDALLKTEGPLNEVLFAEMHAALKSSADAQE
ncbi:Uncharacterized protein SCF082_LOCUS39694, partial [Durusdinium trenchii]